MLRSVVFTALLLTFAGCSEATIHFIGAPEIDCFGVKVALPHRGRGQYELTPERLVFRKDSFTLSFDLQKDKSVSLRRNDQAIGVARPGEFVRFTDEGHIKTHRVEVPTKAPR